MEKQRGTEWFEKRKGRLTGSNAGAALGVNPYKTPDDLIRQMVREYHGAEIEFQGSPATEWGSFNESGAQVEYTMETGNAVQETGFHEFEEWLGASPDGFVLDGKAVVEIKCPYGQREKNLPQFKKAQELPHYYAQMQIEMYCTGAEECHFYQWAPHGTSLEVVQHDDEWLSQNLPILKAFHDHYLSEIGNEDHLKPKRVNVSTPEASRLLDEYDDLCEAEDNAKERKREVLGRLIELARYRDAEIMGRKLTQVERKGNVQYAKVLKDHLPDLDVEPYRGKSSKFWKLS